MGEINTSKLKEFLTTRKQNAPVEALRAAQTFSADESLERRAVMCHAEIGLLNEVLEFIEPGSAAKTPSIRVCYKTTGKYLELDNREKVCFRCNAEFGKGGFQEDPCFVTNPVIEVSPKGPSSTMND